MAKCGVGIYLFQLLVHST